MCTLLMAGIGTDTLYNCYNCHWQRQSNIISAKTATACAYGPVFWTLHSEQNDPLTTLELSRGFILPALISQYRALHFI